MMDNSNVKIIVVTGVESTGKTTLVQSLSEYYSEPYVHEVAREYLENRDGNYKYEDLAIMASQQLHSIRNRANKSSQYLFVDTALIVLKIWSEEKYHKCSRLILNYLADFEPYAYILCDVDTPWEYDPLREHPHQNDRSRLHMNYLEHLQETNVPFIKVAGNETERLQKAALFISELG